MNIILKIVKMVIAFFSFFAPPVAVAIVFKLFCNPASRASVRVREQAVFDKAQKSTISVAGKTVCVYDWGDKVQPVLLIHGWESRGSRFSSIIERLISLGYSPVTFDMPGHGDSGGKNTTILECNEICTELQKRYGNFDVVIAHSFGVPCAFYALKNTLKTNKIVTIGGLAEFSYLVEEFARILNLTEKVKAGLKNKVEDLFYPLKGIWEDFSVTSKSELVTQPILIIHDKEDELVRVDQAQKILSKFSKQANYHETSGFGHKRILHQQTVVQRIEEFIR